MSALHLYQRLLPLHLAQQMCSCISCSISQLSILASTSPKVGIHWDMEMGAGWPRHKYVPIHKDVPCYWDSDFCWRSPRDKIISGVSWSRGSLSAWGHLGIWVPDGSWLTSTGSEHRQRSSCLPASNPLSTSTYIAQGDTGSHGRKPALIITISRRLWASDKKRPHWRDGFPGGEQCV